MHKWKDFWFWFGLILGPVLIILGLFNVGYLLAGAAYSSTISIENHYREFILLISSAVCGSAILRHALKRKPKLNSNTA